VLKRLLLGPQRPVRNLNEAIARAGLPDGRIAVISAGWQEADGDIDELCEIVGRPLVDLTLYHRAEEVFTADPELRDAYRARQDRLIELQRLYRTRLRYLVLAARHTRRAEGDPAAVAAELRHAVSQLRALDRHHLRRIRAINSEYAAIFDVRQRDTLTRHAEAIRRILDDCESVMITGGNVVVLLNRLRLFGVDRLLCEKHLIAWSAGAMVLSDRIVLYHDHTPEGRREPEVFGPGAGIVPGYVFMPDARRRLRLSDTVRVDLLSRRFGPAACLTLDSGAQLLFAGNNMLQHAELVRQMAHGGELVRVRAA